MRSGLTPTARLTSACRARRSCSKARLPPPSSAFRTPHGDPEKTGFDGDETPTVVATAVGFGIREGSYFVANNTALMQMVDGTAVIIPVKKGRNADGVFAKHARIIRKLIPIHDTVREILKCQETDQPWKQAQVRLRIAWSSFVRDFGPINTTVVSSMEDEESGEVRETHRRPNLAPFADDPDCWLVASIEEYDRETNTARPGPIFAERVIAPPPAPVIASAADALAVVLTERESVPITSRSFCTAASMTCSVSSATPSSAIRRLAHGPQPTPISPVRPL